MKPVLAILLALTLSTPLLAELPSLTDEQIKEFRSQGSDAGKAYNKEAWDDAEAAFEAQLAIYDRNDGTLYNLACVQALAGKTDAAVESLTRSVEAGFWDVNHINSDPDLESLRELPGFEAAVARAQELSDSTQDPMAGPAAPSGPFADLAALNTHFDERREAIQRLRRVLGAAHQSELEAAVARDQVAALEALVAAQPNLAPEVDYRAIELMGDLGRVSKTLETRLSGFLQAHPDDPRAGRVLMVQAEQRARREVEGDGREAYEKRLQIMVDASRKVVADFPESPETREAYVWLFRDAVETGDRPGAQAHYDTLKDRWPDDEDFWLNHSYEFYEYTLRDRGLPEFKVTGVNGAEISPAAAKGKVTLLDFWATWCKPCIAELPHLKETYEEYHDKGFEIFGISGDQPDQMTVDDFKAWIVENEMPWPQHYDGESERSELMDLFEIRGIPTTILLDRDGEVVAVNLRGDDLKTTVAEILGEPAP